MTTLTGAFNVIKARLEANVPVDTDSNPVTLRWQNLDGDPLPDTPAPFIYTELNTDPTVLASFGGGAGANRYRNPARIDVFVFVPRGWGLPSAADIAEQAATLFRSYRDADIQCFEATVYPLGAGSDLKPPGLTTSEVDNFYAAVVEVAMFYDQLG